MKKPDHFDPWWSSVWVWIWLLAMVPVAAIVVGIFVDLFRQFAALVGH